MLTDEFILEDVDLEDVDLGDLLDLFEVKCYDGDGESGPCEPEVWVQDVERFDCDRCEAKQQRVIEHLTVNPHDPTAAYRLACGHVVI